jgi:hypothetical protein
MVWLIFALLGCQQVFEVEEPTCGENLLSWKGGLTTHVMNGEGDGTFSYDPDSPLISKMSGEYGLEDGDFSTDATYIDGYFKTSETSSGFGYLWTDGDYDLTSDVTVSFIDESSETYSLRQERWGCETLDRAQAVDADGETVVLWTEAGLFDGGFYNYTRSWMEGGLAFSAVGVMGSDHSYSEEVAYERKNYSMTWTQSGATDGSVERDFTENYGWTRDGSLEILPDGTETWDFTISGFGKKQNWNWTVDFAGNGEGTVSWGSDSCELKFTEGSCRRKKCTSGSNGACDI